VITEFYKTGSPQFRYNIMDLSFLYPRERCACGSWLRRMGKFAGRADNMVKLRGVNVWPEAVGRVATAVEGTTTEYFVRAVRVDGRDELIVSVASDRDPSQWKTIGQNIAERLHEQLGVRITAVVVSPADLDVLTEVASSPKAKRFGDERRSTGPTP
jgi:phenylacetate-CoA ligase